MPLVRTESPASAESESVPEIQNQSPSPSSEPYRRDFPLITAKPRYPNEIGWVEKLQAYAVKVLISPPWDHCEHWVASSKSLDVPDGAGKTEVEAMQKLKANLKAKINQCVNAVDSKTKPPTPKPIQVPWVEITRNLTPGCRITKLAVDADPPKRVVDDK